MDPGAAGAAGVAGPVDTGGHGRDRRGILAAWHAPLFWLYAGYADVVVVFYVPSTVTLSVIIAFLRNRSGQSVIIAIAFHASFNASGELFVVGEQAAASDVQFVAQAAPSAICVAVAVALVIKHGRALGQPVADGVAMAQDSPRASRR